MKHRTALMFAMLILPVTAIGFDVPFAAVPPDVDGDSGDAAWERAGWRDMDQLMWGSLPAPEDFSGRYKLVWTTDALYLLAEITDDVLYDSHADPLQLYWEDDALEIFVDEDRSGGDHLYNYNAFAYHVALDNQAVDIGPFLSEEDGAADRRNLNVFPDHVFSRWRRSLEDPHRVVWEARITLYGADYTDAKMRAADPGLKVAEPVGLYAGKKIGFMLAYCDADGTQEGGGREHFMGDVVVEPVDGDRNRGYIDASVFGEITLVE